ncbi:MAG TPA: class I adenylate-forming enzyme family protein [Methylomirabilota bacterium]|nr:class I adenylate-forming enzyme family protein [Methylomirabilota bacterium]
MNLADVLHAAVDRHPDRPAVTDAGTGGSLSYRGLGREAERVAAFLTAAGVGRGHRIGLLAPNGLAYVPAAFGLLATGACLVPLAHNLAPAELGRALREIDVNGCLLWPDARALAGGGSPAVLSDGACGGFRFQWVDREAEGPAELGRLNPAFVRFTSGTTASSRGVVLSHEATLARVLAADCVLRLGEEDRILWVLPLAYHFAVTIVGYVHAGAHILICPDTLPTALVEAIRRLRPTVLYASPLHFERMGGLAPGAPLGGIRIALSTSAPISAAVMERFERLYGVAVGQAYGLIEAGLPCINLRTDGLPATSVGRPTPGYRVKLLSDGEIAVCGDGLFSAYYAPWLPRERITRDGWFPTGDIGWFDASGGLYLKGRKKAVIFVGGLKFFPEEVEECINQFPGVRESRVFARRHAHLGEVPCAEVALDPAGNLDDLKRHCARMLSPYKVPVEWTRVDTVARTPGGKILRQPAGDEREAGA